MTGLLNNAQFGGKMVLEKFFITYYEFKHKGIKVKFKDSLILYVTKHPFQRSTESYDWVINEDNFDVCSNEDTLEEALEEFKIAFIEYYEKILLPYTIIPKLNKEQKKLKNFCTIYKEVNGVWLHYWEY